MENGAYNVIAYGENHGRFKFTYNEFIQWFCNAHFTCYGCPLRYASFRNGAYDQCQKVRVGDEIYNFVSGTRDVNKKYCPKIFAGLDPHSEQYNRYLGEALESIKDSSNYTIFKHKSKAPFIIRAINYVISSVEMFVYNLTKGVNSNGSEEKE